MTARSFTPGGGIVWLASYPKSGNTWVRLFLACLRSGCAEVDINDIGSEGAIAADRETFEALLGVKASDLLPDEVASARPRVFEALVRVAAAPLVRKVHDAWTLTPAGEPLLAPAATSGAIYVVRDPRDVAVSLADHHGRSLDDAIAFMASDTATLSPEEDRLPAQLPQRLLSWSGHVESWLGASGLNPLVVRYEDLGAGRAQFTAIARFLGFDHRPEAVARALEATRFETLRAQEQRNGFCERHRNATRFFRSGVAGGWRSTLSGAQAARIERDHGAVMARLGYLGARAGLGPGK